MSLFKNFASEFKCFFTNTATYTRTVETSTSNGVVYTNTKKGSARCAFYQNTASDVYVSDKLKAQTNAFIVHDPADISFTIEDQDKVRLDDGRSFVVVNPDNVGNQDGGLIVSVKEVK